MNLYEVLEVSQTAGTEEIKKQFRSLAKKYHPDHNKGNVKWAEAKMRTLLRAYDTLTNDQSRSAYDKKIKPHHKIISNLERMTDDPSAQSRLILYYLLNGKDKDALGLFNQMRSKDQSFHVWKYLPEKDYLDCMFLLGEAYENAKDWKKALEMYQMVYEEESEKRARYFLEDVKLRIHSIVCRKMAKKCPPGQAIQIYRKVLTMGMGRKEQAFLHKKMSEAYSRMGMTDKAVEMYEAAKRIDPALKGTQRIREVLHLD